MVNKYIEESRPWDLAKEKNKDRLKAFILVVVKAIKGIAQELEPFLPDTANLILRQLAEKKIEKGNPLFPRLT